MLRIGTLYTENATIEGGALKIIVYFTSNLQLPVHINLTLIDK